MKFGAHGPWVLAAWLVVLVACEDPSKSRPSAVVASEVSTLAAVVTDAVEQLAFSQAGSKLGFVGSKVTGSHEGAFSRFRGMIRLSGGRPEQSSVDVDIEVDSLSIEPPKLGEHLKSADFFDAARFPRIQFRSTQVRAGATGGSAGATHTIVGNLNLHGREKSISFPAAIHVSATEVAASAEFAIDRRDFDIVYPGMPNDLIRDGVVIKFDLHAPRPR